MGRNCQLCRINCAQAHTYDHIVHLSYAIRWALFEAIKQTRQQLIVHTSRGTCVCTYIRTVAYHDRNARQQVRRKGVLSTHETASHVCHPPIQLSSKSHPHHSFPIGTPHTRARIRAAITAPLFADASDPGSLDRQPCYERGSSRHLFYTAYSLHRWEAISCTGRGQWSSASTPAIIP